MQITITGVSQIYTTFDKVIEKYPLEVVVSVTEDVYANVKKNIYPHTLNSKKKGGASRLENNLDMRVRKAQFEGEVYIDNHGMIVQWKGKPINYALFVLFGTQDHKITPTKKKALRFDGGDGWWFSKGHEVSGIKADPFMINATKETFKNLDKIFKRTYDGL